MLYCTPVTVLKISANPATTAVPSNHQQYLRSKQLNYIYNSYAYSAIAVYIVYGVITVRYGVEGLSLD